MRYRHIFFDLDHTLWDFETNSRATLHELHGELGLSDAGIPDAAEFVSTYEEVNQHLWGGYETGRIPKQVLRVLRFRNTLLHFGVRNDRLAATLAHEYLDRSPRRGALMPGARDLLEDLRSHAGLHVITNGFEEVQGVKLASSGIADLFDVVLTSERAGHRKPDARIFHKALKAAGAEAGSSLMVGDNAAADMLGARNAALDHAHLMPNGDHDPEATYRIRMLDELRPILFG